jgi:hypothetical protein
MLGHQKKMGLHMDEKSVCCVDANAMSQIANSTTLDVRNIGLNKMMV